MLSTNVPLNIFEQLRRPLVLIPVAVMLSVLIGIIIGSGGQELFYQVLLGLVLMILGLIILGRPYIGLAFMAASLTLVDVLPSTPILTSSTALLGAATIGSYFLQLLQRKVDVPKLTMTTVHVWAIIFVMWVFASNPIAATISGTRNWLWTLLQLVILLFAGSVLIRKEKEQQHLMFLFGIAAAVSAFVAFNNGQLVVQDETLLLRSGGLVGINTAARYYTVALVMLTYLIQLQKPAWYRFICGLSMFILLAGIIATGSRSGFIVAVFGISLLLVLKGAGKFSWRVVLIVSIIAIIAFTVPDAYWDRILSSQAAVIEGTDTVGTRYALWQAAIDMWQERPITGVGIGQFSDQLRQYAPNLAPDPSVRIGPHSMYTGVLSETGLIGFLLFVLILALSLRNVLRTYFSTSGQTKQRAATWFITLMILLVGGITKHDQYDKLLWLIFGVLTTYAAFAGRNDETTSVPASAHSD